MKELKLKAMAKINLGLDVLRRRADGYHDLRMIMQSVCLYDQLKLKRQQEPGISISTNLAYLSTGEDNLVYKAAKLLMDEFQIQEGVSIHLKKCIPIAAGLAGGSSDAAAVLVGMNRLFELGLSQEALMKRGVRIGADVPFCVMRGTALSEGIGDILTPLPDAPDAFVVLAKPPVHVSTAFVYGNLQVDKLVSHPDIDAQVQAVRDKDLYRIAELMGNVLETVTILSCPVIGEIKNCMKRQGALNAMMSGSGPTVFGLFDDEQAARRAYEELEAGEMAKNVVLTKFFRSRRV